MVKNGRFCSTKHCYHFISVLSKMMICRQSLHFCGTLSKRLLLTILIMSLAFCVNNGRQIKNIWRTVGPSLDVGSTINVGDCYIKASMTLYRFYVNRFFETRKYCVFVWVPLHVSEMSTDELFFYSCFLKSLLRPLRLTKMIVKGDSSSAVAWFWFLQAQLNITCVLVYTERDHSAPCNIKLQDVTGMNIARRAGRVVQETSRRNCNETTFRKLNNYFYCTYSSHRIGGQSFWCVYWQWENCELFWALLFHAGSSSPAYLRKSD